MARVWHVYGHTIPEGRKLAGCWATVTLELYQPQEMLYEHAGMPYLATFDHEPTEDEMEILRDAHDTGPRD